VPLLARFTLGEWSLWAGLAIGVFGSLFCLWAIYALGAFFTREVRVDSDQPVIDKGPYRLIRHPSFSGGMLSVLGIGLVLGNTISILCVTVFAAIGLAYRIHVEERALCRAIGEPYRNYMRRTKRLVPFVF